MQSIQIIQKQTFDVWEQPLYDFFCVGVVYSGYSIPKVAGSIPTVAEPVVDIHSE
jgi:hypothetical protein